MPIVLRSCIFYIVIHEQQINVFTQLYLIIGMFISIYKHVNINNWKSVNPMVCHFFIYNYYLVTDKHARLKNLRL